MWNELASYRNHFLQYELQRSTRPEHINDMVHKEFKEVNDQRNQCTIPTRRECKHSTYFDDRAQLAYGWFALPKLLRELCSDHHIVQWRAIVSLSEFLLNPFNAQRAITETNIVRKIYNCFMRIQLKYQVEHREESAKLLRIFQLLSHYENGAEKIAVSHHLIRQFYKMIREHDKHTVRVCKILRNLTEKPKVLLMLKPPNAFEMLCQIFLDDPCAPHFEHALWQHLGHFLEYYPERGIANGLLQLFHSRIVGRQPQCHRMNMKMLALMLRCPAGQAWFDAYDCLKLLHAWLGDTERTLDTYEYVMLAVLHGLHSKRVLWRARELIDLPEIVVQIASYMESNNDNNNDIINHDCCHQHDNNNDNKNDNNNDEDSHNSTINTRTQLYSIQVLRQLSQMPCIKRYINANCLSTIQEMYMANYINECNRDELVNWLKREPYHTHDD